MAQRAGHHDLGAAHGALETSSDRSFGFILGGFLGLLAALNLWHQGRAWPYYLAAAVVFLVVSLLKAALLAPLNRLWTRLGLLLGQIVSPIILGMMLYFVFTPIGWMVRLSGRDLLRIRKDSQARSYWIVREPPGPPADSMKEQF